MTYIWWIRDDLRLADNPALRASADRGPVVAVHVDEQVPGARPLGAATRWWLHHSLLQLADRLREYGVPLLLRSGDPREVIPALAEELDADGVTWNRRYHQPYRDADAAIKTRLRDAGRDAESFSAFLLHEPWTLAPTTARTTDDEPASYRVYTPFAKAARAVGTPRHPYPEPDNLTGPTGGPAPSSADDVARELSARHYLPTRGRRPDGQLWTASLGEEWSPGERGAYTLLADLADVLPEYAEQRDRPDKRGTSRMSPHLRFGEISPYQLWHAALADDAMGESDGPATFHAELLWREFAWHRLYHRPHLATDNIRTQFNHFPWRTDPDALEAWQQGRTGIPLVDAGMRELWEIGWMHNRVRMVVGSFLVKNLGIHWREGEQWFWDTLVDADEASNPFNWQWVAGTGDDAAPYFRIFNPETQRAKFDPQGLYTARWVPEAGTAEYFAPLVDLKESRAEALAAYQDLPKA